MARLLLVVLLLSGCGSKVDETHEVVKGVFENCQSTVSVTIEVSTWYRKAQFYCSDFGEAETAPEAHLDGRG